MDTLQPEVYAAITATGEHVDYVFPQTNRVIPSISIYESTNREWARADNVEFATEVEYVIDVWAYTPEKTSTIAKSADTNLVGIGLKRIFSHDLYETETRVHHKTMRYRGVIHIGEQRIYQ